MTAPRFSGASYAAERRTARQKVETLEIIVRQLQGSPTDPALWKRLAGEAAVVAEMATNVRDEIKRRAAVDAYVEGQTTLDMES